MSKQTHKGSRQEEKLKIISSVKGPVAHMMPEDIGKLVVLPLRFLAIFLLLLATLQMKLA